MCSNPSKNTQTENDHIFLDDFPCVIWLTEPPKQWWPLILVVRRQRQEDLCEFETRLVFRVSYRISRTTQWDPVLKKQLDQTNINKQTKMTGLPESDALLHMHSCCIDHVVVIGTWSLLHRQRLRGGSHRERPCSVWDFYDHYCFTSSTYILRTKHLKAAHLHGIHSSSWLKIYISPEICSCIYACTYNMHLCCVLGTFFSCTFKKCCFRFSFLILCTLVFYRHVCLCILGALWGGQKRALDPLELELQVVLNHCEGAENLD